MTLAKVCTLLVNFPQTFPRLCKPGKESTMSVARVQKLDMYRLTWLTGY